MAEFPLLPIPTPEPDRRPPGSGGGGRLQLPDRTRQGHRLEPVFQRLRAVFDEERDPLTLCEDPAGIAPERALVLEVAGRIRRGPRRRHSASVSSSATAEPRTSYQTAIDYADTCVVLAGECSSPGVSPSETGDPSRNIQRKHRRESKQFAAFGQVRAPRFVVSRPL